MGSCAPRLSREAVRAQQRGSPPRGQDVQRTLTTSSITSSARVGSRLSLSAVDRQRHFRRGWLISSDRPGYLVSLPGVPWLR